MQKNFYYYALGISILFLTIGLYYSPSHVNQKVAIIVLIALMAPIGCAIFLGFIGVPAYIITVIITSIINSLDRISQETQPRSKSKTSRRSLLRLILSEEEENNITGDLLEEYAQFSSRQKARFWLYKQILKSALPLIYKNIMDRLTSRLRKLIR